MNAADDSGRSDEVGYIKWCPACESERPAVEMYCEGTVDGDDMRMGSHRRRADCSGTAASSSAPPRA